MAYTQAQLDALQEAYARGILEATLPDGSKLRYRTLAEMGQLIAQISASLTTPTYTNVAYPTHKRGFIDG